MNHKRGRPKARRGGCLLCKPWKIMGNSKQAKRARDLRKLISQEVEKENTKY